MTSPFITERVLLRSSSLSTRTDAFGRFPHSDFANLISCARLCSSFFIAFWFAWGSVPANCHSNILFPKQRESQSEKCELREEWIDVQYGAESESSEALTCHQ